jgi:Holliday junction resolvase RusA-like endonuclease
MGAHRIIPTPLDGDAVDFGALELPILPPSLNNIFLNVKKGRIKSPEYRAWQTRACLHLRKQSGWHVPGPIRVRLTFNPTKTRSDLDNLIKPMLDLLMAAGRISDDRNVRKLEAEFSSSIVGTLIEIRRVGTEPTAQPSAPFSAKKMRSQVAASVAAIGAPGGM